MVLAAVGQICSTASLSHNLAQCQKLAAKAAAAGAKALFLPEASDYIGRSAAESISLAQPISTSPFVLGLRDSAREHRLAINVGIHEPSSISSPVEVVSERPPSKTDGIQSGSDPTMRNSKLLNTLLWIDDRGEITQKYSKLHLFDVDLRPNGPLLKESDSVQPGTSFTPPFSWTTMAASTPTAPSTAKTTTLNIGMLICFDIRFPEPSLHLRHYHNHRTQPQPAGTRVSDVVETGAHLILYPSAFTVPTGRAHWELLVRTRAIETQCFVIASAQCGRHNTKRVSWGGTVVVGPWGEVLGRLGTVDDELGEGGTRQTQERRNTDGEEEGGGGGLTETREPELWVGELDLAVLERVRGEMPLKRRTDVYAEV